MSETSSSMNEAAEDLDFYLMANLRPATTGLPMVVWVSERGNALHDVRIKVSTTRGSRIQPTSLATVAVRPAHPISSPSKLCPLPSLSLGVRNRSLCPPLPFAIPAGISSIGWIADLPYPEPNG
jgi:hypothetical protein